MAPREGRRGFRIWAAAGIIVMAGLLTACDRPGVTFTVDSTADAVDAVPGDGLCETSGGDCTLRAAIQEANAKPDADVIELQPGATYSLSVPGAGEDAAASGDLDISRPVTLQGRGAVIDAGQIDRVVQVTGSGKATLREVTLRRGLADLGGGMLVDVGGQANVVSTTIEDNQATGYAPCTFDFVNGTQCAVEPNGGGGVVNEGSLLLNGVTVAGNVVGGGICPSLCNRGGGGVVNVGTATLVNTTLADNEVQAFAAGSIWALGGGLYDLAGADLVHVTVVDNRAASGGSGITAASLTSGARTRLRSTALAGAAPLCSGLPQLSFFHLATPPTIESAGYNIGADGSCLLTGAGDEPWTNPLLAPLADNGGPTRTAAPFVSSPVTDAVPYGTGICGIPGVTDQRGGPRRQGAACDAGAVEGNNGLPVPDLQLTVDDAADAPDVLPGDGICATAGATCTLRAAVDEANAAPYPDVITIAAGIDPVLSIPSAQPDNNQRGDLDVTDALEIVGGGARVDGIDDDSVIEVHGARLELRDLVVTGGLNGIRNEFGQVDVADGSEITGNTQFGVTTFGGGGSFSGEVDSGLSITDSSVSGNGSTGVVLGAGVLSVLRSSVNDNAYLQSAAIFSGGAGIWVQAGSAVVTESMVSGNDVTGTSTSPHGGGITLDTGHLTLERSTVVGNTVAASASAPQGGGIYQRDGTIDIVDSTISGNTVTGTTASPQGGGLYLRAGTMHITGSTITGNVVTGPLPLVVRGGGISATGGTLTVRNSTFSGNRAVGNFGTSAGAMDISGANATVDLSTFTGQVSIFGRAFDLSSGSLTVRGTIVDETANACAGAVTSGGYNLESTATCAFAGPGDSSGTSALLGPLGGNGGITQTQLPGAGSPAIDAIPIGTAGLCDGTSATDQRGVTRPVGPACDKGSVEQ